MNMVVIAGFLGSGKTTLLLQMARWFSEASMITAVIENELGELGIDGDYLELEGLQVRQLVGGCVCCTLSTGLVETLRNLNNTYHPDNIILEATGVADPGDIIQNFGLCGFEMHTVKVITIVDSNRFAMLMDIMTPLVTSQIIAADIVIINKVDLVVADIVEHIIQEIGKINAHAYIYVTSLKKRPEISLIMESIHCL